jgi:hypothetical protein
MGHILNIHANSVELLIQVHFVSRQIPAIASELKGYIIFSS